MRISSVVLLLLLLVLTTGFSDKSDITSNAIKKRFQKKLPKEAVYTEVPRGLIISLDENVLFTDCNAKIKKNSLFILDDIAILLKELPNYCVIENHTENICDDNIANWELAMMRSANISEYFTKFQNVSTEQLFDIGYGEYMPFDEYLNPDAKNLKNRIDFVIINYDTKR